MSIKDTVRRLLAIGFTVEEAINMADSSTPEPQTSPAARMSAQPSTLAALVDMEAAQQAASVETETRKRRRRNFKARVAYRLTKAGAKIAADKAKSAKLREHLFPTTMQTFSAIVKASPEPIHAGALKAATGLKMKTIESDVYKLRTSEPALIESVKL